MRAGALKECRVGVRSIGDVTSQRWLVDSEQLLNNFETPKPNLPHAGALSSQENTYLLETFQRRSEYSVKASRLRLP